MAATIEAQRGDQLKYSSSAVFADLPLDRSKHTLRLWKFRPAAATVQLDLEVFDTSKACPPYIALSYMWGSYEDTISIAVNHGILHITRNLRDFLGVLHTSKKSVASQYFWADQISMNQQNVAERDHQVGIMGSIFSNAHCVHACLGATPDFRALQIDAKCLNPDIAKAFPKWVREYQDGELSTWLLTWLDIMTRPYWKRLWIVQELWLAKHVHFWCGNFDFSSSDLSHWDHWTMARRESLVLDFRTTQLIHYDSLRVAFLEDDFGSGIRSLIEKKSEHMLLQAALQAYGDYKCADSRDKVFGLHALLHPLDRITVDYSQSATEVALDVARKLICHNKHDISLWDGVHRFRDMGHTYCQLAMKTINTTPSDFAANRSRMDLISREIEFLWWGFLVSHLHSFFGAQYAQAAIDAIYQYIWTEIGSCARNHQEKNLIADIVAVLRDSNGPSSSERSLHRKETSRTETDEDEAAWARSAPESMAEHRLPKIHNTTSRRITYGQLFDMIARGLPYYGFAKQGEFLVASTFSETGERICFPARKRYDRLDITTVEPKAELSHEERPESLDGGSWSTRMPFRRLYDMCKGRR